MKLALAILLVPLSASADSATEEISAGATLTTKTIPATNWISDRIAAAYEANDRWEVGADLSVTRSDAGHDTFATSMSIDFTRDKHWTAGLVVAYSPPSTTSSSATVVADEMEADVDLAAQSSTGSLSLSLGYDTAGDETSTSFSLSTGVTRFVSLQAITNVWDADGEMMSPSEIRATSPELAAALAAQETAVHQFSVDASITRTEGDFDYGCAASLFAYDKDPASVGYFSLATVGRGLLGQGSGVAPQRYSLSPSVTNRWGRFTMGLSLNYGSYMDGGYDIAASVKASYKIRGDDGTKVKLYGKVGGSWSVDSERELYASTSFTMGAQYSW